MDDYAKYYYQRVGNDKGNFGDVSGRRALREKLGCKSFEWYLKNIYPELFIPGESVAHGEVCIACFFVIIYYFLDDIRVLSIRINNSEFLVTKLMNFEKLL